MELTRHALRDVIRRRRFRRLGIAALLTVVGILPLIPTGVSAEISACRDDPIITLSNGVTIQLDTSIGDAVTDVNQVSYTVAVPRGVTVSSVTHVGDPQLTSKETVQVYSVSRPGQYASYTVVSTGASGAPVTVSMQVSGAGSSSTSGQSGQDLVLWVTS
jgi:hypothetical protein